MRPWKMTFNWLRGDFGRLADTEQQEESYFFTLFTTEGIVWWWKGYFEGLLSPTNMHFIQKSEEPKNKVVAELVFLCRVARLSLKDRVRSLVIQRSLECSRNQLRWRGHLVRTPPGRLPRRCFLSWEHLGVKSWWKWMGRGWFRFPVKDTAPATTSCFFGELVLFVCYFFLPKSSFVIAAKLL